MNKRQQTLYVQKTILYNTIADMNIYQGSERRQVGGGIWSTISRGIRPLIMGLIKTLRPHAASAAKRVAKSAVKVGTDMALGAITGRLDKNRMKESMRKEATGLTTEAFDTLKRKLDNTQTGSGNKRRRLNPTSKAKKMPKRKVQRKRSAKRVQRKRKRPVKRSKVNKRKNTRGIKKRKNKRQTVSRKVLRDIFNS